MIHYDRAMLLQDIINSQNIPSETVEKWIDEAGVSSIYYLSVYHLSDDTLNKLINYYNNKGEKLDEYK